jgi:hypothetical protein
MGLLQIQHEIDQFCMEQCVFYTKMDTCLQEQCPLFCIELTLHEFLDNLKAIQENRKIRLSDIFKGL